MASAFAFAFAVKRQSLCVSNLAATLHSPLRTYSLASIIDTLKMFLPAFIIALLTWPALVLSLSIELTPKQRNVTKGEATQFHYKPKDQIVSKLYL